MIGIGPQELIRRAQRAAQQEIVVHEPALQDLARRGIGVEGNHGQLGRPRHDGTAHIGLTAALGRRNPVLAFGRRECRGVIAHQVIDGKHLEILGRGFPQINVEIVAHRVQHLVERVVIFVRDHVAPTLQLRGDFAAPPALYHALQLAFGNGVEMIRERNCRQCTRTQGAN